MRCVTQKTAPFVAATRVTSDVSTHLGTFSIRCSSCRRRRHHCRIAGEGRRVVAPTCRQHASRGPRSDGWNRFVAGQPLVPWTTRWATPRAVRRSVDWYVDVELSSSRATCPNTEMRRRDRRWDSEVRPVRCSTSSFRTRIPISCLRHFWWKASTVLTSADSKVPVRSSSLSSVPFTLPELASWYEFNTRRLKTVVGGKFEIPTRSEQVSFSFPRQLTTWHCSHLLLNAVLLCGSNRSIPPARGAHSSKPAARCCRWERQTGGRTQYRYIDPAAYYAFQTSAQIFVCYFLACLLAGRSAAAVSFIVSYYYCYYVSSVSSWRQIGYITVYIYIADRLLPRIIPLCSQ